MDRMTNLVFIKTTWTSCDKNHTLGGGHYCPNLWRWLWADLVVLGDVFERQLWADPSGDFGQILVVALGEFWQREEAVSLLFCCIKFFFPLIKSTAFMFIVFSLFS
jgi:hypothetical protein